MDRRGFFLNSALASAGAAVSLNADGETAQRKVTAIDAADEHDFSKIPIFCAHEHWGSINAIGMATDGFRSDAQAGATPERDASLWDIVLDPYFGGWIFCAGHDVHKTATDLGYNSLLDWWHKAPEQALASMEAPLRAQHCTGAFQCIRQGILALYGLDIAVMDTAIWKQADEAIKVNYQNLFSWYRNVMKKMNVSELIRPVHPEYFLDATPQADEERALMHPIVRIDGLLDLWPEQCPRRDRLAGALGVEPGDAPSWRAFLGALFDLAASQGNVGIKQLQAYTRPLDFARRSDNEIRFKGDLDAAEKRAFQDWVMHECCKQAHERGWPHQIHTGTHNLGESSPLPLASLAALYPKMKMVLLHCWPFLEESGFLAKHTPNIYLDSCWQTILNPAYLEQALAQWSGYMPATKLMCSQDATNVEMAAGSIVITRRSLSHALTKHSLSWKVPGTSLCACAADILHNNAVRVYGVGTLYSTC